MQLALDSAQEKPDVIYLTGGSARSPLIKKALPNSYRAYPSLAAMISAPVTAGLARWAEVVFR
ncbi:Putative heat shock protein YegD [Salmonella enterica subsp. enterica]|uniref:Heat shock protein YegD n=1 Tax=Salmonella enterica I TaxID=59201 RepID=A0A379WQU4_SALET|nr:Putative heat shock protein YegD [Salmonella enterica subsp. enterica]